MKSIIYFSINPKDINREEWTSYPGYTFVATLPRDHKPGDEVKGHLIRGVPCDCDPLSALDQGASFTAPALAKAGYVSLDQGATLDAPKLKRK